MRPHIFDDVFNSRRERLPQSTRHSPQRGQLDAGGGAAVHAGASGGTVQEAEAVVEVPVVKVQALVCTLSILHDQLHIDR